MDDDYVGLPTHLFFRLLSRILQRAKLRVHVGRKIPVHLDLAIAGSFELEEEVSGIVEAKR
jgi:hypothetical protein